MKHFRSFGLVLILLCCSSFLSQFISDSIWVIDNHHDIKNPHRGWHHQRYTDCSLTRQTNNNFDIPSEVLYDRFPINELIDMTCIVDESGIESCDCAIDLDYIDTKLASAEAAGQRLSFRFYFYGLFRNEDQQENFYANSYKLEKCGYSGTIGAKRIEGEEFGPTEWIPDLQAADLVIFHRDLLDSLSRYDGHPLIDFVEVGSAGHYGEWHAAHLWTDSNDDGIISTDDYHVGGVEFAWEDPSLPYSGQIIQDYFDNFTETPLVMQIGGKWDVNRNRFNYVIDEIGRNDFGLRGDGFGDSGRYGSYYFDTSYSHTVYDSVFQYKHTDGEYRFRNQWQRGPILFEVAFAGFYQWFQFEKNNTEHVGSYIENIIDKGREYHLSILNHKNSYIPGFNCPGNPYYVDENWTAFSGTEMMNIKLRIQETLPQFLQAYGYKIKLEDVHIPVYDQSINMADCDISPIKVRWNNIGVAPCYYDYYWAIKLIDNFSTDQCSDGHVIVSDVSIKGVLPNFEEPEVPLVPAVDQVLEFIPILPNEGNYKVFIGLVSPGSIEPKISLTNQEYPEEVNCKWHFLGTTTLTDSEALVIPSSPNLTLSHIYETNQNIYSTQTIGDPGLSPDDIKNLIAVDYNAGITKTIQLAEGFEISQGVIFNAYFDGCSSEASR